MMKINILIIIVMLMIAATCSAEVAELFSPAVGLFNQGDLINAKIQFEEIVRQTPDNADAHGYLGLIYEKTGDYPAAIKAYKEVIRLKPGDLSPYYNLGLAYYHNKNYEEAQAAFDVAQKKYGDNPDLLYYDALSHYNVGEFDDAISALKTLHTKHPSYDNIETRYLLAVAYFNKGMADEAANQFNTVVKVAPDYTNWDRQARNYIALIDQKKALRLKELTFSFYGNLERDSNVAYATNPAPTDGDNKTTLYGSLKYRPVLAERQDLSLGYSFYNLTYGTHTTSNLFGNIGELSYNLYPLPGSILALKANGNFYSMAGSPYLINIPVDCRFTFKILPGAGMWSIAYVGYALDRYRQASYLKQNAASVLYGLKQYLSDSLNINYEGKNLKAAGDNATGTIVDDYSYSSHQFSLSYFTLLPEAFSLSLDGGYSVKNYLNADSGTKSTVPTKRTNNILTASLTLSKTIFWELGLLLKVNYLADACNLTAAQSTLGYGSYSSTAYSLGLTRAF